MRLAGFAPIAPYSGNDKPWESECLSCHAIVSLSLQDGRRGARCPECGIRGESASASARIRVIGAKRGRGFKSLVDWGSTEEWADRVERLCNEWHATKNDGLTPSMVSKSAMTLVWWQCPKFPDHEWETSVGARTVMKTDCPFCAGKAVALNNSLATTHPHLAGELDLESNPAGIAQTVNAGSGKKLSWRCPDNSSHVYVATVSNRTAGKGCPYCAGKKVDATNSLAALQPELASEWHPTKNGAVTPAEVTTGSGKRVWWKCAEGPDHEWQATPASRATRGSGCPFCAGQKVSVTNCLAVVAPHLVEQWHPTKNGDLTARDITAFNNRAIWWKCPIADDHEWTATPRNRVRLNSGCPACVGRVASSTNNLSLVAPAIAAEFASDLNGVTPDKVPSFSGKRYAWRCLVDPTHVWNTTPSVRLSVNTGCPSCAIYGYDLNKPGWLYVLCGSTWGKYGITNYLDQRLGQHSTHGHFGDEVLAVCFEDGEVAQKVESQIRKFAKASKMARAPRSIPGFSESFPATCLQDVLEEFERLVAASPAIEAAIVERTRSGGSGRY